MGSTVFANTLAVATSTSAHFGATIVDIRLVDKKVPTPLLNYIASEHIARNFPTTVLFDKGKVWNEPTEVGDPPKSIPADTFPTPKGAINSYAMGAAGAGSGNVFVGGKKVLCHTHTTEQNAKNSKGKIVNWAELQKLIAEAEENERKRKAKADADAKSKSQGKGAGASGAATVAAAPPQPPPVAPPQPEGCAVAGAMMVDASDGTRFQSPKVFDAVDAFIELLDGGSVKLTATPGKEMCAKHVAWTSSTGWSAQGPTADFQARGPLGTTAAGVDFGGASLETQGGNIFRVMDILLVANARAMESTVTATGCKGEFRRKILTLPKVQVTPTNLSLEPFSAFGPSALGKLGVFRVSWQIKPPSGAIKVEGKWIAVPSSHKCAFRGSVKGVCTVIDASGEITYSLLSLPIPEPTLQAILKSVQALNAVTDWATGRKLIDVVLFLRGQGVISASFGLEADKPYESQFRPSTQWVAECKGEFTIALGIRVEALSDGQVNGTSLAKGEGRCEVKLEITGRSERLWPPSMKFQGKLNKPAFVLELTYDLTIFWPPPTPPSGTGFWSRIKNQWNDWKGKLRDKVLEAFGNDALKGGVKFTVEFNLWDEKPFELGTVGF